MDSSLASSISKRPVDDGSESDYSVSELFQQKSKKVRVVRKSFNHLHDALASRSSVALTQHYTSNESLDNSFEEDGSSLTDETGFQDEIFSNPSELELSSEITYESDSCKAGNFVAYF